MSQQDFLIEIGTEELPPVALPKLYAAFEQSLLQSLQAEKLGHQGSTVFASPRRIAVLIKNLATRQADQAVEKLGPAVKAAYDADGNPSKAAEGFARGCGVAVSDLDTTDTDKGERLVFRSVQEGKNTAELLPGFVEAALANLPIPKRMRWGASRAEFVRPVHWVLMLFGEQVLDAEVMGLKAGNTSRGHRFHAPGEISINSPAEYAATLKDKAWVIADFDERRQRIVEQVKAAGEQAGGIAVIDEDLLDEVTALVEWPVALAGGFEQRFLEVPQEALIYSMKEHQKYFHVVDADGKLLPHFITVSNIESQDPQQVISGNERVIRPRLSDAAFFFDTDRKTSLEARREKLKSIVFQKQLGSIYDKTARLEVLAAWLAEQLGANTEHAARAAALSKSDLVSDMVGEFDKMQGVAGDYYARHDGEAEAVAEAIQEQYLPKSAGDALPASDTGLVLALADRLDTLSGIFGIGEEPTGSKDPFALRRASVAVLRLIIDKGLNLDLRDCLAKAISLHPALSHAEGLEGKVLGYMVERMRAFCEDDGISVEVFYAVSAKKLSAPLDIDRRIKAVHSFSQLPEAEALAAANKRVANILAKAEAEPSANIDEALLQDDAERALAKAIAEQQAAVEPLFAAADYSAGLSALAGLREVVDRFFDEVMVMTEDEALRNNRLAILQQLRQLFWAVADISQLAPSK